MGLNHLSNMITSIRNAANKKHKTVEIPATNLTRNIAKILLQEKFIINLRERDEKNQLILILTLRYHGKQMNSCITAFKQITKPGLKVYKKTQDIPKILGGIGVVILSTSKGILTDREARQLNVGGELLCSIW
jgi:small subunit ribosomal protein S8